jgi:hypothetical protein
MEWSTHFCGNGGNVEIGKETRHDKDGQGSNIASARDLTHKGQIL